MIRSKKVYSIFEGGRFVIKMKKMHLR